MKNLINLTNWYHYLREYDIPSGEKISDIINNINHKNLLGLILSCVSPENFSENLKEVKNLGIPFGFKLNAFVTTNPKDGYTNNYNVSKTGNPNEFLGNPLFLLLPMEALHLQLVNIYRPQAM